MHPYSRHGENAVGRRRAKFLTTGKQYARGGHADEAEDKKLMKRMMREHEEMEPEGEKAGGRLDKRARGGGKMQTVMHEFKSGKLHSGSSKGPKVTSRKQAIAIGLSEARKAGENVKPMKRADGGGIHKMTPSKRKPHMSVNIVNITGSRGARKSSMPGAAGRPAGLLPSPPVAMPGGPPLAPPMMKRGGGVQKRQYGGPLGRGGPLAIDPSAIPVAAPAMAPPLSNLAARRYYGFAKGGRLLPVTVKVPMSVERMRKIARIAASERAAGGKIGIMRRGKDYGQGSGEGRLEEFKHMRGK